MLYLIPIFSIEFTWYAKYQRSQTTYIKNINLFSAQIAIIFQVSFHLVKVHLILLTSKLLLLCICSFFQTMPSPPEVVVRTCNSVIALLSETSTTTSTAIRDPLSGGEGLPLIQKHRRAGLPNEIARQNISRLFVALLRSHDD